MLILYLVLLILFNIVVIMPILSELFSIFALGNSSAKPIIFKIMSKYFVVKNGEILKSYVRRALAYSFYFDVLDSIDLDFDIVEFWHEDSCLLINSING